MKIALAGNPNSGKTTLFNAITGKLEYVGNWAGVTVDKKIAPIKSKFLSGNIKASVVDLPGAYSIEPFTGEEAITKEFIINENPDVIINIIDSTTLERGLFFTTQLAMLQIPMIIALNKEDLLEKKGIKIDIDVLSKLFNCSVVHIQANKGIGLEELVKEAINPKYEKFTPNLPTDRNDIQIFIKENLTSIFINKSEDKVTISDKADRIFAHGIFGLPIFALIMWFVYYLSINGIGGFLSVYINDVLFGDIIPTFLRNLFENLEVNEFLSSLIIDGAIAGVGAVLGFLPLIMVLFFLLALLEDSGYMARVAVVMDRYLKKIGLSGKSIIPMIVGSGCAIPGIMASRTIEDENERRITAMLTPFVPCGAKLPVIALLTGVFFSNAVWVGPSMYLIAFFMIGIGGIFLKKVFVFESKSHFIMELPNYKIPSVKHAMNQMFRQAKAFIIKASTIILVMNTLVWFMQAYSFNLSPAIDQNSSIIAYVGSLFVPILIPLGFGIWLFAAASITGFIAKENVVATVAVLLATTSEEALGGILTQFLNPVTAYAFLVFNLFTPPCFAAIGALNSELSSKKWLFRALSFQLLSGYTLALLSYQIGSIVFYGQVGQGFKYAIIYLLFLASLILYLLYKANYKRKSLN